MCGAGSPESTQEMPEEQVSATLLFVESNVPEIFLISWKKLWRKIRRELQRLIFM